MAYILTAPNPMLRQVCTPVGTPEEAYEILLALEETAEQYDAMEDVSVSGLAAPQIGITQRALIFKRRGVWQAMVNPVIVRESPKKRASLEGCLSLPNILANVERPLSVVVEFSEPDEHGEWLTFQQPFGQPLAVVVQHEIDHLNGLLITEQGEVRGIQNG